MSMNTTTARGIRCGHCNGRHVSVTDVRSCSQGIAVSNVEGMSTWDVSRMAEVKTAPMVTTNSADDEAAAEFVPLWLKARHVPAGRYAVEFEGKVRFFKVDKPNEGKWAGLTFVKEQASDDFYPVRGFRKSEVLLAIAAVGADEASKDYGKLLGVCGVCGRTLTDEQSRAQGIGPVCIAKMGW